MSISGRMDKLMCLYSGHHLAVERNKVPIHLIRMNLTYYVSEKADIKKYVMDDLIYSRIENTVVLEIRSVVAS